MTEEERDLIAKADTLPVYVVGQTVLPKVSLEELGETPPKRGRRYTDDLRGYRFGDLVVLGWGGWYVTPKIGRRHAQWRCWCLLANVETTVAAKDLKTGNTTASPQAGNRKRIAKRYRVNLARIDGRGEHPLYPTWKGMVHRCYDVNAVSYPTHGARGVRVCDKIRSWEGFRDNIPAWPDPSYSLERLDTNGHYSLNSLAWAPTWYQSQTRRNALDLASIQELNRKLLKEGVEGLTKRCEIIAAQLACDPRSVHRWISPNGKYGPEILAERVEILQAGLEPFSNEPCTCDACTTDVIDPDTIPEPHTKASTSHNQVLVDLCDAIHSEPGWSYRLPWRVVEEAMHRLHWHDCTPDIVYADGVWWRGDLFREHYDTRRNFAALSAMHGDAFAIP